MQILSQNLNSSILTSKTVWLFKYKSIVPTVVVYESQYSFQELEHNKGNAILNRDLFGNIGKECKG